MQVVIKSDAWTEEEKKLKDLTKHEKNLAGKEVEQTVFQKVQSGLGKVRDIVAISGWEVYGPDDKKVGDFDFLVISLQLKAVVHIEVKRQLDERSLDKAFEQLAKAENLFRSSVPFPVCERWSYLKFVYFEILPESEQAKICCRCRTQLIQNDACFVEWWKQVQESALESNSCPVPVTTYLCTIKFILYHMLAQENVITKG